MPASFGIKVTAANVEDFIATRHCGIDQWAADYPQYAKAIRINSLTWILSTSK
jgi:hypothetical protein